MHSHPTYTLAMNYVHELDEKKFTHTLVGDVHRVHRGVPRPAWACCPGCSAAPTPSGRPQPPKMKEFRLVIWGMHGIYGAGKTLDETFGLIETVEKAAQIYMLTAHLPRVNTIKDSEMQQLAEYFGVNYRRDFLDL